MHRDFSDRLSDPLFSKRHERRLINMAVTSTSTRVLTSKRGPNTPVCELWIKEIVLLLVAMLVLNTEAVSQPTQVSRPDQIKAEVQKRGVNHKSQVRVSLVAGTEVKGFISKIEDTSFEVTDKNSRQATSIAYADVEKIKKSGLSKGTKVGVGLGVGVVIAVVVFALTLRSALHS